MLVFYEVIRSCHYLLVHKNTSAQTPVLPQVKRNERCEHRVYNVRLNALCEAVCLSRLSLHEQSKLLKTLMRDAALKARGCILESNPNSGDHLLLHLTAIAMAIWYRDRNLAETLWSNSELGKGRVCWDNDGSPCLANFPDISG